jgi:16S rRNA (cytosine1402-N4)-methyltransferase
LRAAFKLLRPGGIIAVITWKHSEAALVTEFLRENELAPDTYPLRQWWEAGRQAAAAGGEKAAAGPRPPLPKGVGLRRAPAVCPSEAELRENSRSRSAVLHILHKEEGIR